VRWLCHPDDPTSPCSTPLPAVELTATGPRPERDAREEPAFDCFYVYPTVSRAVSTNAPRASSPEIEYVVRAQAARFQQVCRLFAPLYRQVTLLGIATGSYGDPRARAIAHADVLAAWEHYLAEDNDGRPFLLLGHSQGSLELTQLLTERIEPRVALRERLVSAMLLGGPVTVPVGADVGGSFRLIPACRSRTQTGCVVAYHTFGSPPPEAALFARTGVPDREVLCVNPASPSGGRARLDPVVPDSDEGSDAVDRLLVVPDGLTGRCRREDGASWFHVRRAPGSLVPAGSVDTSRGAAWGLHRADVNVALDDLVALAADQADALLR
jgi:hypothetical protein